MYLCIYVLLLIQSISYISNGARKPISFVSLSWLVLMMTCSCMEPPLPSSEIGAVHAGTVGIIQLRRKSHWWATTSISLLSSIEQVLVFAFGLDRPQTFNSAFLVDEPFNVAKTTTCLSIYFTQSRLQIFGPSPFTPCLIPDIAPSLFQRQQSPYQHKDPCQINHGQY